VPAHTHQQHRAILQRIARRAMLERGLLPTFSAAASAELQTMQAPSGDAGGEASEIRDLTNLVWASIDNDDSRDLDQLTVADMLAGDRAQIRVAIADVDALVKAGSAIDAHARHNTTSVYTAAEVFPMLPEQLSTNLTSLNAGEERLAVVVDMVIGADGSGLSSEIYRARVRNHAKLAYNSVAAWLEGRGTEPQAMAAVDGLAENLRLQDRVAQALRVRRHNNGALSLKTIQSKPLFDGDELRDLAEDTTNRAKQIIEDFMIAANGVTARYLTAHRFPSIRRVVRTPKRWDRIVRLALEHGFKLPDAPDSAASTNFSSRRVPPIRCALPTCPWR
jgi:VacB/RNase II family 3'-5' exoribonuclease